MGKCAGLNGGESERAERQLTPPTELVVGKWGNAQGQLNDYYNSCKYC